MAFVKTAWVDRVTPVSAAQLNRIEQGVADAHLGVATGQTTAAVGFPAGPVDGQEHTIVVSSQVSWRFKYDLAGASWKFIGGPPVVATGNPNTDQTTLNTWIAQAGTPSWVAPFAGDYDVLHGHVHWSTVSGGVIYQDAVASNLGTRAVSPIAAGQAIMQPSTGNAEQYSVASSVRLVGVTANATINLQTYAQAGTARIRTCWMNIQPVRMG